MPRKRKPAAKKAPAKKAPPKPAGAKAEKGKGGTPKKSPYSQPGWRTPWFDKGGKKKKPAKKAAPKPKPKPRPDAGPTPEPLKPVDALAEYRKKHPIQPPTFTGQSQGDLGGGPMQNAPGAPQKQNGAPVYSVPTGTPYVPAPVTQPVNWGQLLSDYFDKVDSAAAGYLRPDYSSGVQSDQQQTLSPYTVRPDIDPATAQAMMAKVSGGVYQEFPW